MSAMEVYKKVGADFSELGAAIEKAETERDAAIRERDEARKQVDAMKPLIEAFRALASDSEVGTVNTKPIRKLFKQKAKPFAFATADADDEALIEALRERKDADASFVTANQLFEVAVSNGFKLSRVSVRNRMIKLVKANTGRIIEKTKPTLGWRLA